TRMPPGALDDRGGCVPTIRVLGSPAAGSPGAGQDVPPFGLCRPFDELEYRTRGLERSARCPRCAHVDDGARRILERAGRVVRAGDGEGYRAVRVSLTAV